MANVDVAKVLSYGVIGLGFLLALLAYRLITKEQQREQVRPDVLRATYVFMAFSLTLCGAGLISESLRGSGRESSQTPASKLQEASSSSRPVLSNSHDSLADAQVEQALERGIRNYFDSEDWTGPEPSVVMGLAKGIADRFSSEQGVFQSVEAEIERHKREDNNWTFANRLQSALALVHALGLSPSTEQRNRVFRDMVLPAIQPKRTPGG
jgi:hypothetical protein